MNILVVSHQYYPVLGGVPVVARLLAQGFLELEATVRLVTSTPTKHQEEDSFDVYRNPGCLSLLNLFRWADRIVMIGPSVRSGWPAFFSQKPCVISHQAGVPSGVLQRILTKKCFNIACSDYLATAIGGNAIGVPNPFNPSNFKSDESVTKERDFIFVGRLVKDKGADVFIRALSELQGRGVNFSATIVGAGQDEQELKELAVELGLADMVAFTGPLYGSDLTAKIQTHRIGIVPSRWQEPFGIVALELIACGLSVIVARVGGLPEAAGPCGLFFEGEDHLELSYRMEELISDDDLQQKLLGSARKHLEQSIPRVVADSYLEVLSHER